MDLGIDNRHRDSSSVQGEFGCRGRFERLATAMLDDHALVKLLT
jgi:hypothetical protein